MNLVSIDEAKCTQCRECVTACLGCITEKDGEIVPEVNEKNCFFCGHCVSVCPTGAITHHGLDMKAFTEISKPASIATSDFLQFIQERRSHRSFQKKKVTRADLQLLVEACRHAPTGSNRQKTHILIIQDQERIAKLARLTIEYLYRLRELIKRKVARLASEGKEDSTDYQFSVEALENCSGVLKRSEAGSEPIFFDAPALMIFHSESKRLGTPQDDCVIAAHTVTLLARTLGLESCYSGAFVGAAQYYPPAAEELHLPPNHMVYSVLILGYPQQRYIRTVDRKPIQVRWE